MVALASPVPAERLEIGIAALRALGFEVVLGKHVLDREGHHAGEPAARAGDLHALFSEPGVDAIFCARGGSSSIRVLEHLDFERIRAHPKIFVGYSDVTTVMLALLARCGLRSFFGPMVTPDCGNWPSPAAPKLYMVSNVQAAPATAGGTRRKTLPTPENPPFAVVP